MFYATCIGITILAGFTSGLVQKHLIARYTLAIVAALAALGSMLPAREASLRAQDACSGVMNAPCYNEGVILFILAGVFAFLSIAGPYLVGEFLSKRSCPPTVGGR